MCSNIIELDVGGRIFKTTVTTLSFVPDSFFGRMFSGEWTNDKDSNGRIFIDRDGELFHLILEYLRNGRLTELPNEYRVRNRLRREADFYGLTQLIKQIDSGTTNANQNDNDDNELTIVFKHPLNASVVRAIEQRRARLENPDAIRINYPSAKISLSQLRKMPQCRISEMFSGDVDQLIKDDQGRYVIERPDGEKAKAAAMLVEFLKFGKYANYHGWKQSPDQHSDNSNGMIAANEFHHEAKHFNVPFAVEYIWKLKWQKQV